MYRKFHYVQARLCPYKLVKLRLKNLRRAQNAIKQAVREIADVFWIRPRKTKTNVLVHEEQFDRSMNQWKDPWIRVYAEIQYSWLVKPEEDKEIQDLRKSIRKVARSAGVVAKRTNYAGEFLFEGLIGDVWISAAIFHTTLRFFVETEIPWYAQYVKNKDEWLRMLNKRF